MKTLKIQISEDGESIRAWIIEVEKMQKTKKSVKKIKKL